MAEEGIRNKGTYGLVEHEVYEILTKTYKYNTALACGILANIYKESSFNPKNENKSSKAYGLFQWLGTRKANLAKYCDENYSGNYNYVPAQLAFMVYELSDTEKSTWDSISGTVNNAAGAESAATLFSQKFERHGNTSEDAERGRLARTTFWEFYSKYYNTDGSSPYTPSSVTSVKNKGRSIVDIATEQIGKSYQRGGKGPDAFDDVGLVYYSYNEAGVSGVLYAASAKVFYETLKKSKASVSTPRPGDILVYKEDTTYSVGIYDGKSGSILVDKYEGVIREDGISSPYDIIRVVADSETSSSDATPVEATISPAYVSYNESAIASNLARVAAVGYDYGYLIDLTNGGEFKFYIPEFTEQAGANYSSVSIIGRSVDVKAYDNTASRAITVSLDLYAGAGLYVDDDSNDVVGRMHSDLNFVKSLEYPDYQNAIVQPPPIVQLILGSAINLVGVVSGVSVEHLKPLDSQNRSMYTKLSFTVTQTSTNPPDYRDIREGRYILTSTGNINN